MFITPKLYGADEVKTDLGGHWRLLLRSDFYSLTAGQMWLKFGMESPWYLWWFVVASCMGLHGIAQNCMGVHRMARDSTGRHGMAREGTG